MLHARTVLAGEGVTISEVSCRHARGTGEPELHTGQHSLVFVRRGCFVRTADGVRAVLDPTTAYCVNPGEEQRYDHPHEHGDDCTVLAIDESLLGHLPGGPERLPAGALQAPADADVEHRVLVSLAGAGGDGHEVLERALTLVERLVTPQPVHASGASVRARAAREALVGRAREALAADPNRGLSELARELAVSPYHLSRTFRLLTGATLARHRMRLRARGALGRIADGDHDLARVAADAGFSDQSYMCRVIRAETGSTPAALRRALA
jgi:AraC-like DNA-binding protein